jgi:hypothetical protein
MVDEMLIANEFVTQAKRPKETKMQVGVIEK